MNPDVSQNELLSAYLDGELTAEQRAEVEQLLADSPQARQLLDELRTLSATLRAMPRHELGEDLSAKVVHLAQRQVLLEKADAPRTPDVHGESRLRRMFSRRALLWSGLAVTVAVAIMISERVQEGHRLALAPRPAAGTRDRALGVDALREAEETRDADKSRFAAPQVAAAPAESPAAEAPPPPAAPSDESVSKDKRESLSVPSNRVSVAGAPRLDAAGKRQELAASPAALAGTPYAPAAGGLLVVQCDVSPQAAGKEAFAKLLVQNQITFDPSPPQSQLAANKYKMSTMRRAASAPQQRVVGNEPAKEADQAEDLELVYVEAPPERIEATLDQLASQREDFPAISLQAVPGIESPQAVDNVNLADDYAKKQEPTDRQLNFRDIGGTVLHEGARGPAASNAGVAAVNAQNVVLGRAQRISLPGLPLNVTSQPSELTTAATSSQPATSPAAVPAKPAQGMVQDVTVRHAQEVSSLRLRGGAVEASGQGGGPLAGSGTKSAAYGYGTYGTPAGQNIVVPEPKPSSATTQQAEAVPPQPQQIQRVLFVLRKIGPDGRNVPAQSAEPPARAADKPVAAPSEP